MMHMKRQLKSNLCIIRNPIDNNLLSFISYRVMGGIQIANDQGYILYQKWLERSDMTWDFTTQIHNCPIAMIENLCLCKANKLLKHLRMPLPNRTAAISTCVELGPQQSYNAIDLLMYIKTDFF